MPKLRVHNLAMSLDGYAAGPDQSVDNPLGDRGDELHEFFLQTTRFGGPGGSEADERFMAAGEENIGATIMGRNMFGPVRGEWGDSDWKGWWGANPPYHHPVFVLTHHAHDPIEMEGGTTFHFVTDGIESALEQAFAAAGGQGRPPRWRLGHDPPVRAGRAGRRAPRGDRPDPLRTPASASSTRSATRCRPSTWPRSCSSPDSKVTHVQLVRR